MSVPTQEPETLTTGDTWTWSKSLADYPATAGWSLSYVFANADYRFDLSTAASGPDHVVSVAYTATSAHRPGVYAWQAYVTHAGDGKRFTVGRGNTTISAGLSTIAGASDQRTQAEIALEAALAAYANYAATNGKVAEYEIDGRRMKFRSPDELRKQVNFWRGEVEREQAAERIRLGLGTRRKVYTRFAT